MNSARLMILSVAALAVAGCKRASPQREGDLRPVLLGHARPFALCHLAQDSEVVHGRVIDWSPPERISVPGYDPERPFSRVRIDVDRALGQRPSGPIEVLFFLGVASDGQSIEGSLTDGANRASGYFLLRNDGGRLVLTPEGFFRESAGTLKNEVRYQAGISEGQFLSEVVAAGSGAPCDPLPAQNGPPVDPQLSIRVDPWDGGAPPGRKFADGGIEIFGLAR